jgi:hypothetical protein
MTEDMRLEIDISIGRPAGKREKANRIKHLLFFMVFWHIQNHHNRHKSRSLQGKPVPPCHLHKFYRSASIGQRSPKSWKLKTITRRNIMDENAPSPAEVPPAPPVPGENPPTPTPVPAPPPATALVVNGTVKSEREIELETQLAEREGKLTAAERRALEAERRAAELERDNQELKKIPAAAPRAKAEKHKRNWLSPIIGADDE